jgi:hypothetical protein
VLNIMDAELIEGNYVLYQGDLSTKVLEKLKGAGKVRRSESARLWPGPGK